MATIKNHPEIEIRNATKHDLNAILAVEQSWHKNSRASEEKFISRLERFPLGFFLAYIKDEKGDERVVATITAMPSYYTPSDVSTFNNWDKVTNNGLLFVDPPLNSNALYIVSGVIDDRYRGLNIFSPMVSKEISLASSLGYDYVLAGAVLPGYRKYCEQQGECSAYEYCLKRRGRHLVDPLLSMYESLNFQIPNANHVIPEYYPDDASKNYAGLVVYRLEHDQSK